MKRRLLSLAMALVMCLGLLPASAFAETEPVNPAKGAAVLGVSEVSPDPNQSAESAFDGDRQNTKWFMDHDTGWTVFQLSAPAQPAAMMVYHASQSPSEPEADNTEDYCLEVLDAAKITEEAFLAAAESERSAIMADDSYWKNVGGMKDNTQGVMQSRISMAGPASVFRFHVIDAGWNDMSSIYEIEFRQDYILPESISVQPIVLTEMLSKRPVVTFTPSYTYTPLNYSIANEEIAKMEQFGVDALASGVTTLTVTSTEVPALTASTHIIVTGQNDDIHEMGGYQAVWLESFETGSLPDGWTTEDKDQDGHTWMQTTDSGRLHHGEKSMCSAGMDEGVQSSDNWLITPELTIGKDYLFSFACKSEKSEDDDSLFLYALEQGKDPVQLEGNPKPHSKWDNCYADLAEYAGKTIRLALVHRNETEPASVTVDCCHLWAPAAPGYTEEPVIYEIVNGVWADGTDDYKIVHMPMTNGTGTLLSTQIPTGMRPNLGFKGGSWDVTPNTEVNGITGRVTYTYTFEKNTDAPSITVGTTTLTDLSVDQKGENWEWDASEQQMLFEKGYNLGRIKVSNLPKLALCAHNTLRITDCWNPYDMENGIVLEESRFVNVDLQLENCQLAEGATAPTRIFFSADMKSRIDYQVSIQPDADKDIAGFLVNSEGNIFRRKYFRAPCAQVDLSWLPVKKWPMDDVTFVLRGHPTLNSMTENAQPVDWQGEVTLTLSGNQMALVPYFASYDTTYIRPVQLLKMPALQAGDLIWAELSSDHADDLKDVKLYLLWKENGQLSNRVIELDKVQNAYTCLADADREYYLLVFRDDEYDKLLNSSMEITLSMKENAGNTCLDLTSDTTPGEGETWTWNKETHTLTLKDGFRREVFQEPAIFQRGDLTLVVEGKAEVLSFAEGILVRDGELTIQMKPGAELNAAAMNDAICAWTTVDKTGKPVATPPLGSLHILGQMKDGKRPLVKVFSKEDCLDADVDLSVTNCQLDLNTLSQGIALQPDFDDPRQDIILKNCLTNIISTWEEGILSNGNITIDGGQLTILAEDEALEANRDLLFRNDPILDVRVETDNPSEVIETGDENFTIPGEFQLLDTDHQVIYTGTWDEGVNAGIIRLKNNKASDPAVFPVYVIMVTLEDGTEVEAKGILREKQEKPVVNPFTDVNENDYFYDYVQWAVQKGITSGISPTEFGPNLECSRAQIVTFLWSAAGKPAPALKDNPFTDVPEGAWYHDAVLWAVEKGITSGLTDTTFGPAVTCSRAQAMTFLWTFMEKPDASAELRFTDVQAGAWYEKPVQWAVENGITSGLTKTEFGTAASCLRSQILTFMYKALNQ